MVMKVKAYIDYENVYYSIYDPQKYGWPKKSDKITLLKRHTKIAKAISQQINDAIKEANKEYENEYILASKLAFADIEEFPGMARIVSDYDIQPQFVKKYKKDKETLQKNAVDIEISSQIVSDLSQYHLFILVAGDKDYTHVFRYIREKAKKIYVVAVRPAPILKKMADKCKDLEIEREVLPTPRPFQPPRDFMFRAILLRNHMLTQKANQRWINRNELIEGMSRHKWFDDLPGSQFNEYIIEAQNKEVIIGNKIGETLFFTSNYCSFLWKDIIVKSRLIQQTVKECLKHERWAKLNWVAIRIVLDSLFYNYKGRFAENLRGRRRSLDEEIKTNIRWWLTLCTEEGILIEGKERKPGHKEVFTTTIKPNPGNLLLKHTIPLSEDLQLVSLIIITLDFLTLNNTSWISQRILKGLLEDYYGTNNMQQAIALGEKREIIEPRREKYENMTTDAYHLNGDNPFVKEVVKKREEIVSIAKEMLANRWESGVNLKVFLNKLIEKHIEKDCFNLYGWIAVLGNQRIFYTDQYGATLKFHRHYQKQIL